MVLLDFQGRVMLVYAVGSFRCDYFDGTDYAEAGADDFK